MKDYNVEKVAEADRKCFICGEFCMDCKFWLQGISDPFNLKNQPERLNPEEPYIYSEFGCSIPIKFNTSKGIKTMIPGKRYDENLNEIGLCDSPNSEYK